MNNDPITPDWLVPDILCRGSMIILAGDAGVGKSMICYALALATASGGEFLGRKVPTERVLYFDEENSRADSDAYHRRVWLGLGSPEPAILDANLHLYHFALGANYAADMARAADEVKPGLIIIDTANAACRIDDENDNAKASAAIKILRKVRESTGRPECTVLVLKHARLAHDKHGNEYRDIRGAKTWKGELDGLIIHTARSGRPPAHGKYRNTVWWPSKSRAFGLLSPIEIVPQANGEAVKFNGQSP